VHKRQPAFPAAPPGVVAGAGRGELIGDRLAGSRQSPDALLATPGPNRKPELQQSAKSAAHRIITGLAHGLTKHAVRRQVVVTQAEQDPTRKRTGANRGWEQHKAGAGGLDGR
jgi:hypothetical protein